MLQGVTTPEVSEDAITVDELIETYNTCTRYNIQKVLYSPCFFPESLTLRDAVFRVENLFHMFHHFEQAFLTHLYVDDEAHPNLHLKIC
jgi:hypothetical protein